MKESSKRARMHAPRAHTHTHTHTHTHRKRKFVGKDM